MHHDGAIGADGISVDLNDAMKLYSLPVNVKYLNKAIKLSVKLLYIAPIEVMIVFLGLTFLSPLVQFLQKMESTAERILRMWGDRIGRRRLNSKIELQKTYYPRGMVLVTGEDLPSGQSSNARLVGGWDNNEWS